MENTVSSQSASYSPARREELRKQAEKTLIRIRPALQADGGDAEIVDVTEDGRLQIRLLGTCGGCPMSPQTLKQGIEKIIHHDVPEIRSVEAL